MDLKNNIADFMSTICEFLQIENEYQEIGYNDKEQKFVAVANNSENKDLGLTKFNTNKSKEKNVKFIV